MVPKSKTSEAGHWDMPNRNQGVLPLSEKVTSQFNKEKNHAEVAENDSSICQIEKE